MSYIIEPISDVALLQARRIASPLINGRSKLAKCETMGALWSILTADQQQEFIKRLNMESPKDFKTTRPLKEIVRWVRDYAGAMLTAAYPIWFNEE